MSDEANQSPHADAGRGLSEGLGPTVQAVISESQKAICAALGAAAAAREQDLRGQYPKAARVLAEEVFRLRKALDQKHAEYEDMKSLLLGNARQLHVEGERLRADNAALRREAHAWWTAARDAMKLREPLASEVIEAAAAEAFGFEGGLQEVNLGDLLQFARVLEQRHGIGA
jgi:hypothetical protein